MKSKILTTILLAMLCICYSGSAYAMDKPANPSDPFNSYSTSLSFMSTEQILPSLSIAPSENTLMGSACSNLYATTGDYCSGHMRIYYQCLETLDGGEWQQRTENCEDYIGGGRCAVQSGQAKCVDYAGTSSHGKALLFWGIGFLIVGVIGGIFVHPIFYMAVVLGLWLLLKFFVGGV